MNRQCSDQTIQRYYHVLTAYLDTAKQLEHCTSEDQEFYQDICYLFATKMKALQAELADHGLMICQHNNQPSSWESVVKKTKK